MHAQVMRFQLAVYKIDVKFHICIAPSVYMRNSTRIAVHWNHAQQISAFGPLLSSVCSIREKAVYLINKVSTQYLFLVDYAS